MKQRIHIIACLLATAFLAGCSGSELPEGVQPVDPADATIPLNVQVESLDAEVDDAPGTRAATTLTTGSIGIFRDNTNDYTAVNNIRYNYGSPKWTPQTAGETIYLGLQSTNVCAYYPWTNGYTNSAAIPLTSAVYNANNDLSYATNRSVDGRTNKTVPVTFAMTRAYARVGFKLKRDNYPGTCLVTNLTVKYLLPSATLNITNGTYSAATGTNAVTLNVTKTVNVTTSVGASTDWPDNYLLVPCTPYGTGMEITLTVDSKTMTTTIPTASYKPVAGEYKTITLTLKGTDLKAGTVTTENWESSNLSGEYIPLP